MREKKSYKERIEGKIDDHGSQTKFPFFFLLFGAGQIVSYAQCQSCISNLFHDNNVPQYNLFFFLIGKERVLF